MRKSRFTDAQIIGIITKQEAGLPTADLCRKHGLSPATFYKLKAKYGGMDLSGSVRGTSVALRCRRYYPPPMTQRSPFRYFKTSPVIIAWR